VSFPPENPAVASPKNNIKKNIRFNVLDFERFKNYSIINVINFNDV
jgi:hypothetical protein